MAGGRIKGITVEIDGSTTGLNKALEGTDKVLNSTAASLKDVNRLLKLDPKNTELLQQKQKLLASAVSDTSKRLDTLKKASEDAAKTADNYNAWKEAFTPVQNEMEQTKERAKELRAQMNSMKEVGEVNTDSYRALQAELKETNSKLKDLKEQAKKVGDEFGNPISPKQYDALQREIIETEQKLGSLEKESAETASALEGNFKDAAQGAGSLKESIDDIGDTVKKGVFMEAADQVSEIGDKLSELGGTAMESFNDMNDASAKASAYFGETGKAAEDTAGVIKDVYEGGVGDSMDAVSDAVIAVKNNLGDLDQVTLTNLTNQALTLEDLYGIDMNETLRGVSSLMQNFDMTAQEAMDHIVAGTQNGLDKTNELGDNLSEYSGKFSQAGYSAQEYFQLLNNGLDGGAYNLDKVNDAINEVTTKLVDGTIEDSLSQINEKTGKVEAGTGGWGEEVESVFKQWQQGGATQKDVIDAIVKDIQNTENQQDKLNKAALAFGTMGEDGNAKFIESLTSVGNSYDDVSGKAQGMFEATSTPSQEMEANMRKLKDSLAPLGENISEIALEVIPPLAEKLSELMQWFSDLPKPIQGVIGILPLVAGAVSKILPIVGTLKGLGLGSMLTKLGGAITGTVLPAIGSGIAAFGSFLVPILPIVAAIAGVVAAGVLLYKNWDKIKEKAGELKDRLGEKFSNIKEAASEKFSEMKDAVSEKFSSMKEAVTEKVGDMKANVEEKFSGIKQKAFDTFSNMKQNTSEAWGNMKQNMASKLSEMYSVYQSHGGGLKGSVSAVLTGIKGTYSTQYNAINKLTGGKLSEIASSFFSKMGSVKSTVSGALQNVKSSFSSGLSGAFSTVSGKMGSIKDKFSSTMESAKNAVGNAISRIKDKFNFSWSLPKLKLPHISISGKFSINPPSVPKFGISWYKKAMDNAIVMDRPTAFGYDAKTNSLLAGGEAGREVVSGESHLISLIGNVVKSQNGQLSERLDKLNSLVQLYFPKTVGNMEKCAQELASMGVVLDTGTLVGELTPGIDKQLRKLKSEKGRGR